MYDIVVNAHHLESEFWCCFELLRCRIHRGCRLTPSLGRCIPICCVYFHKGEDGVCSSGPMHTMRMSQLAKIILAPEISMKTKFCCKPSDYTESVEHLSGMCTRRMLRDRDGDHSAFSYVACCPSCSVNFSIGMSVNHSNIHTSLI